jgi:hypothetical protein
MEIELMNNFFLDKEKIKVIDTFRIYYFIIGGLSFLFTEIGRYLYRPFIYENKIDDYGLADSVGNWGGIIVQVFFGLAIINPNKKKGIRLILFFTIGYVIYEILQLILPRGVFDYKDIYGTFVGGFISLLILLTLHYFCKNKILKKY